MSEDNGNMSMEENDVDTLRDLVAEYLGIPDKIEKLNAPLKALKARQKELCEEIQRILVENNHTQIRVPPQFGDGLLVLNTSTKKATCKKDNWVTGINTFLRKRGIADVTADDVIEEVESTREYTTSQALKRIKR